MSVQAHGWEDAARAPVAARLRAARAAVGLTQAQAAVELGVSRPLLIAIERGTREPQPAELVKLAQIYGRSVSDLLRPTPPPLAVSARFRTAFGDMPGSGDLAGPVTQLEALADDYLDLLHRAQERPPGRDTPAHSIEHLDAARAGEDIALEERSRLNLGDGPVPALREILEIEVGLRVFMIAMPGRVAGLFVFVEPLGGCVAVNKNHPTERQRWTMAHEHAHFLVSRGRAEITSISTSRRYGEGERFADAFAANFLMPRSGLARRFHELKRGKGGKMTAAMLVQLAHAYRVSVQALTLRLEDLGLVRSGTWERLRDNSFQSRVAARRLGPESIADAMDNLPLHYRTLAVQLYADGEITETQLARYLHTDVVGARQAYEHLTATHDITNDGAVQVVDLAETPE
ncbi:MAG TPA: XRE family transcriptional regulator [Micromonosporaceae bacterium]|nr:XRE family transcriptional regulator [Micromonosporaceae bacterium]